MIVYELRCDTGHGFDAWFRNSDAFEVQRDAHQVSCPTCGSSEITKAPMAPRIGKSDRSRSEEMRSQETRPETTRPDQTRSEQMRPEQMRPEHMRMVMSQIAELNRHVAETCDYVGSAFPEEARKIHYGETKRREIYGEASPDEAMALRDEGVEVAAIPWVRRSDS